MNSVPDVTAVSQCKASHVRGEVQMSKGSHLISLLHLKLILQQLGCTHSLFFWTFTAGASSMHYIDLIWNLLIFALLIFSLLSGTLGAGMYGNAWEERLILTTPLTFQLLCYHSHQGLIYSSGAPSFHSLGRTKKKIICSLNRKKVYTPKTKPVRQLA